MAADRQFYAPDGGTELKADNSVFDVQAWREDLDAELIGQGTTLDAIEARLDAPVAVPPNKAATAATSESISVQTIAELATGDYFEVWIENNSGTDDITVEYLSSIALGVAS